MKTKKDSPTRTFYVGRPGSSGRKVYDLFEDNMSKRNKKISPTILELLDAENQRLAGLNGVQVKQTFDYQRAQDELRKVHSLETRLMNDLRNETVNESCMQRDLDIWSGDTLLKAFIKLSHYLMGSENKFREDLQGTIVKIVTFKPDNEMAKSFKWLTPFRKTLYINCLEAVIQRRKIAKQISDYQLKKYFT
jgi:hypothetical protein